MVSPAGARHIERRLLELAEEFDLAMAQDATLPATERVGVSLVLAKRPWSLSLFADLRRAPARGVGLSGRSRPAAQSTGGSEPACDVDAPSNMNTTPASRVRFGKAIIVRHSPADTRGPVPAP